MKENFTSRKFTTSGPQKSRVGTKSKAASSKRQSDYEAMLRLYVITKEQSLPKKELKYIKINGGEKAVAKDSTSSIRNNIYQMLQKANQFISTVSRPVVALVSE